MGFRTVAVIIGVNDAPGQTRLRNAEHDAQDLASFLRGPWAPVAPGDAFVLVGPRAGSADVRAAFRAAAARRPDLLLVSFSGHGSTDSVCLADGPLSHRLLGDWIRGVGAQRGAVIIDACHAEAFASQFSGEISGVPDDSWQHLLTRMLPGMRLLLASRIRETAADGPGRNGLFTAGLLDAFRTLRGDLLHKGSRYITAEAAFRHAARFVLTHSAGTQSPVVQGRVADFAIARPRTTVGAATVARPVGSRARPVGARRVARTSQQSRIDAGQVIAAALVICAAVYIARS